jgi:hypothetical protein
MALLPALAGCAVSSPFAIQSTGAGPQRETSITLASAAEADSTRGHFARALEQAFAARSVRVAEGAPLLADFSATVSLAQSGVLRGKGDTVEASAEPDWIAAPRRPRRFDKCDAQRLRATLVVYDRANGAITYRGSGEGTDCAFDDGAIADLADRLVADAMR